MRELARTSGGIGQTGLGQQPGDTIVHGGADHVLLGDAPRVIVLHPSLDQAVGHAPTGFGSRDPLIAEARHGRIEIVTGQADAAQRLLGRSKQLRKLLGTKEGLIVVAFELDLITGQSLGQRRTLLMVDVHVVGDQSLLHLGADTPHRIEVAHRILRHQTHLGAAQLVVFLLLEAGNLLTIELDGTADHMAGSGQQAEHGHGGSGFA